MENRNWESIKSNLSLCLARNVEKLYYLKILFNGMESRLNLEIMTGIRNFKFFWLREVCFIRNAPVNFLTKIHSTLNANSNKSNINHYYKILKACDAAYTVRGILHISHLYTNQFYEVSTFILKLHIKWQI